jgi:hypothetical protein
VGGCMSFHHLRNAPIASFLGNIGIDIGSLSIFMGLEQHLKNPAHAEIYWPSAACTSSC